MEDDRVRIDLSSDEALVLYDWVCRTNNRTDGLFQDQAEQRVLWDVEAMLERHLVEPFRDDYDALLAAARDRVRDPVE